MILTGADSKKEKKICWDPYCGYPALLGFVFILQADDGSFLLSSNRNLKRDSVLNILG